MRISKRQLRRIIREEKRRLGEDCGDMPALDAAPVSLEVETLPMAESTMPEQDLMVEMEVAQRALEQVVESVQNAAQLCPQCNEDVAMQAPLMEAIAHQAEALQEMLDVQAEVVAESATVDSGMGLVDDLIASVGGGL
jgi:tRNA G26 N,N-dimethylase Trm1